MASTSRGSRNLCLCLDPRLRQAAPQAAKAAPKSRCCEHTTTAPLCRPLGSFTRPGRRVEIAGFVDNASVIEGGVLYKRRSEWKSRPLERKVLADFGRGVAPFAGSDGSDRREKGRRSEMVDKKKEIRIHYKCWCLAFRAVGEFRITLILVSSFSLK